MSPKNKVKASVNIERHRKEAKVRSDYRALLDNAQQIKVLDDRLGVGIGAVKERKRLLSK